MEQFIISASSGIPIYKQLYSQVERMVLNGYFPVGQQLPSVRQVASDLDVNPMTVSKAYGLLEERGYLTRLRGKGMIVNQRDEETLQQDKLSIIEVMIGELLSQAHHMGISQQEIIQIINRK
ncbi:GntR family transcriptional regulator [Colwellia piezophila]|uniref:GntR family transcriptional regulator n=1 Tax=Colwellia piezophila TaxID=211668 RepID=UPI00036107E8|nr:GntR family transcriptional regulator [Colwellia piezophila]